MAKSGSKKTKEAPAAPSFGEVIEIPNKLQVKVGADQGANHAALRLAEDVVRNIKPTYEARFKADMRALKSLYVQMQDTKEFDLPLLVDKVHDIRGEAGTFGYSLVTEIGRLLCEFIASIKGEIDETEQLAVAAHLQAMQTVVVDKVKGEGPEVAKQIIAGLNIIIKKAKR
jgi:hypothetical protein